MTSIDKNDIDQTPDIRAGFLSIIVAARNEEKHISACLDSIFSQDYPVDAYEVLVGDDQSVDNTALIIKSYAHKYHNVKCIQITHSINGLVGKSNVLAQLTRLSKGEFLIFLDADVIASPHLISTYIKELKRGTAMLSGGVVIIGDGLFASLQNAGYIAYTYWCAEQSEKGNPITAMGANMAISNAAYQKVGGYERIPFTVTEDYELFKAVTAFGYKFKALFNPETIVQSYAHETYSGFLKQRRRWLSGSFQSNWRYKLQFNVKNGILIIYALLYFIHPIIPVTLLVYNWIKNIIFLKRAYKRIRIRSNLALCLFYPYSLICNTVFLSFQFLPSHVYWKGRDYGQNSDLPIPS